MSKTTIKELALSLSEKHDLSRADAERFAASVFEVINDGLEDDKLVKVKGLGAFKIIGVAARKSVDVNTGEPIVIEGRNKISFTPDASMRDDVNKPFSQFETVVINDGVDFSSIDKEYEDESKGAPEKKLDTSIDTIADDMSSVQTETIEENKQIQEIEAGNEDEDKVDDGDVENKEDVTTDKDNNKEQDITEENLSNDTETLTESEPEERESVEKDYSGNIVTSAERETSEENDTSEERNFTTESETSAESDFATERSNIEREVEKKLTSYQETHQSHAMKALAITAVTIVIACLCGGYYLFSQIQRRDSHIEMLEKQMKMVAQHQKKKKAGARSNTQIQRTKQEQDTLSQKPDIKQEATKQGPLPDNKQQTLKAEDKQLPSQEQYNKDIRIRTGAYAIIGIKKTVTVRSGQTMEGISRSSLGPGMECYLEAVNGGKRELKAGESINIPELRLKKRLR